VTSRIRFETVHRATCDAPINIQGLPGANEMTASEMRSGAARSTHPAGTDSQPEEPHINTSAIEGFLQAAQSTPLSSGRIFPQSDPDTIQPVEVRTAGYCWTSRVISGAESGEPLSSSSPAHRLGDECRDSGSATALNCSLKAAGKSDSCIQTVKEPI